VLLVPFYPRFIMMKTQWIYIESLENRRLFSFATIIGDVLVVNGDPIEDDTIVISRSADTIIVDHDDVSNQRFNVSLFTSITLAGDTGDDTLVVEGSIGVPTEILGQGGNDTIDGGRDLARLDGGTGRDHITGTGILVGGSGNDTLLGGRKRDFLYGGSGADSIRGGRASDIFFGGSEDDTCKGQGGNDVIFGEDGRDKLRGGEGNDKLFGATAKIPSSETKGMIRSTAARTWMCLMQAAEGTRYASVCSSISMI
jgi:Ca2+-binding RTX toxin-like protein